MAILWNMKQRMVRRIRKIRIRVKMPCNVNIMKVYLRLWDIKFLDIYGLDRVMGDFGWM